MKRMIMSAGVALTVAFGWPSGLLAQDPGPQKPEAQQQQGAAQKPAQQAAELKLPARYRSYVANLGNVQTSADNQMMEFEISRWSTDEEQAQLLGTLQAKGPREMLSALQDFKKVGWVRSQGGLSWDLRYARQSLDEKTGDRTLMLITDRIMGFWELAGSSRTRDYPFTVIQVSLKPKGPGEGTMMLATKIEMQAGVLVFEDLSTQPAKLMQVTKEK